SVVCANTGKITKQCGFTDRAELIKFVGLSSLISHFDVMKGLKNAAAKSLFALQSRAGKEVHLGSLRVEPAQNEVRLGVFGSFTENNSLFIHGHSSQAP